MSTQATLPGFPVHAPTIQRDGMDWPLETFIDAYGFARFDPEDMAWSSPEMGSEWADDAGPPQKLIGNPVMLEAIISRGGSVTLARMRGDELPWGEVIAARLSDEPIHVGFAVCASCGAFTTDADCVTGWCDDCMDCAEPGD